MRKLMVTLAAGFALGFALVFVAAPWAAPSPAASKAFVRGWLQDYSLDRFQRFCEKQHVSLRKRYYGSARVRDCVGFYQTGMGTAPFKVLSTSRKGESVVVRVIVSGLSGTVTIGERQGRLVVLDFRGDTEEGT